jgi:hypothetical protein
MTTWRMAFRQGSRGYELWPTCYRYNVAAISYGDIDKIDLSRFPHGEPADLWQYLSASQKSSLKRVAYEMTKGDVIYVKQGPLIVGRGRVKGRYKFRLNRKILDSDNYLWPHQVPVAWEPDFPSFRLLLGGEQHTVLKLTEDHLIKLKSALSLALADDEDYGAYEGDLASRTIKFRKRNRAIIEAKKRTSRGICEACFMAFHDRYRLTGKDCLHVHHKSPMAERDGVKVTNFKDLVLLCPNCHAVVHVFSPALTFDQLKRKIK